MNVHVYVTEYVREYVREDGEHVCMLEIGRQGRAAQGCSVLFNTLFAHRLLHMCML